MAAVLDVWVEEDVWSPTWFAPGVTQVWNMFHYIPVKEWRLSFWAIDVRTMSRRRGLVPWFTPLPGPPPHLASAHTCSTHTCIPPTHTHHEPHVAPASRSTAPPPAFRPPGARACLCL